MNRLLMLETWLVGLLLVSTVTAQPAVNDIRIEPRTYRLQWWLFADVESREAREETTASVTPLRIGPEHSFHELPDRGLVVVPLAVESGNAEVKLDTLTGGAGAKDWLLGMPEYVDGVLSPGRTDAERVFAWTVKPPEWFDLLDFYIETEVTCYNTSIDESKAARVGRPEAWETSLEAWLMPELYIESNNPDVTAWLTRLTKGRAKEMRPYPLAKYIVRAIAQHTRQLESDNIHQPDWRRLFTKPETSPERLPEEVNPERRILVSGLRVNGARRLAKTGQGSPYDAICLFVAAMRAADVPARPVIGVHTEEEDELIAWAEFYLPDYGWIPVQMTTFVHEPGRTHDVDRPWEGFGTDGDLNDHVPLSFRFVPDSRLRPRNDWPLIWGLSFDPSPQVRHQTMIRMNPVERGERR